VEVHGSTRSGTPVTDEVIEHLADEAERGYDVDHLIARRGKRGRPRLGSEPSTVESVRLDPEMKERLVRRAEDEGVPVSEVIREALRHYLEAS
jgi:Ribbon-helix-helix protein, copG family